MVKFYSNNCPRCRILESQLKSANIAYEKLNDVELLISNDMLTFPVIEVDGKFMNYEASVQYIQKGR